MQNAYASKGGYLDLAGFDVSTTQPVIENIKTAARARCGHAHRLVPERLGRPVRRGWRSRLTQLSQIQRPENHAPTARTPGTLLAKGGWDYQLVDELVPEASDIVLPKPRYSGFFNTRSTACCAAGVFVIWSLRALPPTCAWSRPCATAFSSSILGGAGGCHPSGRAGFCPESRPVQYRNLFGWVSNVNDFCDALDPRSPVSPEENRYAEIRDYSAGHQHSDCPFVPGTLADGVVYVSGTLPFDKDNNVVFINDPRQTRHVLETIKTVIETAGGTMEDVTFNSIFITDWKTTPRLTKSTRSFSRAINRRGFASSAGW